MSRVLFFEMMMTKKDATSGTSCPDMHVEKKYGGQKKGISYNLFTNYSKDINNFDKAIVFSGIYLPF